MYDVEYKFNIYQEDTTVSTMKFFKEDGSCSVKTSTEIERGYRNLHDFQYSEIIRDDRHFIECDRSGTVDQQTHILHKLLIANTTKPFTAIEYSSSIDYEKFNVKNLVSISGLDKSLWYLDGHPFHQSDTFYTSLFENTPKCPIFDDMLTILCESDMVKKIGVDDMDCSDDFSQREIAFIELLVPDVAARMITEHYGVTHLHDVLELSHSEFPPLIFGSEFDRLYTLYWDKRNGG